MKTLKKTIIALLIMTLVIAALTACSKDAATFTKDDSSKTSITFNLKVTNPDGSSIIDAPIKVVGEGANLMEIMEWYLAEKSINFVQDNGMVTTISDLESDASNGWLLYVNDAMSEVGAGDYIPAKDDKVEWKYVDYSKVFGS